MSANSQYEWFVTAQRETVQAGPTGEFQAGWQITFQVDNGLVGTVFLPLPAYNPANVAQAVAQQVKRMLDVHVLRGVVRPGL